MSIILLLGVQLLKVSEDSLLGDFVRWLDVETGALQIRFILVLQTKYLRM